MILVAGATGALGGQVAQALLAQGHDVRVLVREGSDYDALVRAGAQPVIGDLKDPASLARACAGVDTVLTTANSAQRGGADNAESVEQNGNRALIDAAAAAGVGHFIFTSALGAAEDSPVEFLRAKAAAERHLRESTLVHTILQPNVFMEVWFGMLIALPLQQGQPVTLVGRGDHRHTFISMRDVTAFLLASITHPDARNATLPIGGPEPLSWMDVVREAEVVTGHGIELRFIQPGEPLPGLPAVVSELAAGMEHYESVFDTAALAQQMGVRQTSARELLGQMLPRSVMP
jgi:uncharacterized protein YbjT (DUF2867 family)